MKKLLLVACAAIAVPALAQVSPPAPAMPAMAGHAQGMHMGMNTRADIAGHVDRMFAMLDTNRDGVIDQAEMAKMGEGRGMKDGMAGMQGEHAPRDRNAVFDRLDTNHDGMISRDEFARAPSMRGNRPMGERGGMMGHGMGMGMGGGMRAMFAMADANHDGRITRQEALAAATRHFDMIDTNHDGTISADEHAAARGRMQAMHGGQ